MSQTISRTNPPSAVAQRQRHWAGNRRLSAVLLAFWFMLTVGVIWFADSLNQINLIGPMGYYMAAQGALLGYLLIIGYYAHRMKQLDAECDMSEDEP